MVPGKENQGSSCVDEFKNILKKSVLIIRLLKSDLSQINLGCYPYLPYSPGET